MSKRKVALVMQELLYEDGMFVYSGGDRYTRDLAHLVRDMGMEPTIFQKAQKEFFDTTWEGVRVVGLPSKTPADLNMDVAQNTQEYDATIYFNMLLAYPRVHRRSVSISHGIWFDHVKMPAASDDKWAAFRNHLQSCVSSVDYVVSVDTNTINFFGGLFSGRFAPKFIHIPNSVDVSLYKPAAKKSDNVRVLYPRRWEILRGSTEMMRLSEELSAKRKNAEFHFCGRAHSPGEEKAVKEWSEKNPNFAWYWKKFDEMPAVYQGADIAVIPTIGCEGTSYSCLESLASGLPVVSTYVGGLSELVIDGFNGIKVAPRYEEIRNGVDYLIRNPAERERMGRNARATGESFSKTKWRAKWEDVIKDLVR